MVLGIAAVVAALYFWWKSGSSGGAQVPGSDEFVQNSQAALDMIGQIGTGPPTPDQCASIRNWYNAAMTGYSKMQAAGVQSQALTRAQQRLDTIKKFLDDHCS